MGIPLATSIMPEMQRMEQIYTYLRSKNRYIYICNEVDLAQKEFHNFLPWGLRGQLVTRNKIRWWWWFSRVVVSDSIDCSPPGSSVHGILQARIVEWVAIPFSRESYWPRDWTQVFCIAGGFFTSWATRKTLFQNKYPRWWEEKSIFSKEHLHICFFILVTLYHRIWSST